MLSWIVLLVLVGFLVICAIHIIASCYQLIKLILHWTPKKQVYTKSELLKNNL